MATVNYSVPEDVKQQFNDAFSGENKSAVIANLMMMAVKKHQQLKVRKLAAERLVERHRTRGENFSSEKIREARGQGRP